MLIYLQVIETEEDKNKFEDIYQKYRGLMYYVAYVSLALQCYGYRKREYQNKFRC
mgnify:CR=1 FL=1